MKPSTATAQPWPAFQKLAPAVVHRFLDDEERTSKARRQIVEMVEKLAGAPLREFIEPVTPGVKTTTQERQRIVATFAAFISMVEYGLEDDLRGSPALLKRFRAARDRGLTNLKSMRAVLVASLDNAAGLAKGESLADRLERSVASAKEEPSIDFGSFAAYADESE
jgi:hypothetical protein